MEFTKHRFEFFSDGLMAIVMTIMVLQIPIPNPFSLDKLDDLLKSLLIFFVSFFIVGGFLYKHHHLVDSIKKITNKIIWKNFVFLFFIALLPVFTKLIIENYWDNIAIIIYDIVFLLANISFFILALEGRKQLIQEEIEIINSMHEKFFGKRLLFLRFILVGIVFLGMVLLAIIFPKSSIIMYIVFPIIFNLLNIFKDNGARAGNVINSQNVKRQSRNIL
jgi:uncharacterized membrane protein